MPQVLTTTATILCPHGGKGTTTPATPYVDAQGGYVAAEGDVGVLSCVFIVPCVSYTLKSMGLNASTIAGKRIILATDFQQSATGMPLSIVETTSVVDDSTPAPLPAGASSASLAPELLDVAPPVVVAVPPTMPFVSSTMQPATAPIAFTLTTAYPLAWTLTLLNSTQQKSIDVTNGVPGLVVAPAGGAWSSPSLTVTATMTAAFLAALGPGTHYLYMTGVSKRGMSSFALATLVVS
jgi:hypothetical protein